MSEISKKDFRGFTFPRHPERPPCHPEFISGSKILKLVQNDKVSGFTLAEVLITLAIIGVVAALTIPVITKKAFEQEAVSKVKKHYRNIAAAVQQWQVEEGCTSNVGDCISQYTAGDCRNAFTGIEKKLQIIDRKYRYEAISGVGWLPDKTTLMNGDEQQHSWQGVSKISSDMPCFFLLADGTTMNVYMPDDLNKNSGFMNIDINGKKPPNRVGKDVFPIGLGTYGNNKYKTVNPYYAENSCGSLAGGLCCISYSGKPNNICDPDECTQTSCSPTAYVLKHGKLPPITW